MSTAEVARDMDVLRRMVGDKKLTYLGFSYGTYLGNVYANLFPDRVRAVVIDGVLDPLAWAGTNENAGIPQTQRLKSGEGASKALDEVLARCAAAGPEYCLLAGLGDPAHVYAEIVASLKENPVVVTDEDGEPAVRDHVRRADLGPPVRPLRAGGLELGGPGPDLRPQPPAPDRRRPRPPSGRRSSRGSRPCTHRTARRPAPLPGSRTTTRSRRSRACCAPTGATRPRAEEWVPASAAADAAAPGFGPLWTWASAPCASSTWTVRDEDGYTGPFTRRTAAPVLVVGNYWDPATNYEGAVAAAGLLPRSSLLSSDSWGHTAYGTSACVTDAVDAYLLTGQTPAAGTVCTGDVQPFTEPLGSEPGPQSRGAAPSRPLPPVVPPLPGAVPRS